MQHMPGDNDEYVIRPQRAGQSNRTAIWPALHAPSSSMLPDHEHIARAHIRANASGFTHEKPRAERDGRLQNQASSPALRGAPVSKPERVFAKRAELPRRSHA